MKMQIRKSTSRNFVLNRKIFDQLNSPIQVWLYATLEMWDQNDISYAWGFLEKHAHDLGISATELDNAIICLSKIGYLELI
jgi:hypothetical protein